MGEAGLLWIARQATGEGAQYAVEQLRRGMGLQPGADPGAEFYRRRYRALAAELSPPG